MIFNKHSSLEGLHAFLSASKYHWINYSEDKLAQTFLNMQAFKRGTELHELASRLINLGVKLPRTEKTLNMYVNDAIGFRMTPEQVLFYSEYCFGTADAISFRNNKLRIHDLKTGKSRVSMKQLLIYAALFCLEYRVRPGEIEIELRIYKEDEIEVYVPEVEEVAYIMDKIVSFNKYLKDLTAEEN